jgi:hypothetical protein
VKREAEEVPQRALGHPWGHQPVVSYSAGRDIEAKLISEATTGTKLDITADNKAPLYETLTERLCATRASSVASA